MISTGTRTPGSTSGVAVATLARELGAEVVIASSNAANVNTAVERMSGATGSTVDLRNEASVSHFFESLGAFDHLAITAGAARCLRPRGTLISLPHARSPFLRCARRSQAGQPYDRSERVDYADERHACSSLQERRPARDRHRGSDRTFDPRPCHR